MKKAAITLFSLLSCYGCFAQPPIEWQKCLGGSGYEYTYSIQQTTDGGFVVAGYSESYDGDVSGNHSDGDYWIVKLDTSGNIQWQKCFGGSGHDHAYAIDQTDDGGFVVAGYSASDDGDVSGNHGGDGDYWIVKLDTSGNIEWQKCLGGSSFEWALSIQQTLDGGFVVAGLSNSYGGDVSDNHGAYDYWIVKLDSFGNIEWQKSLGGIGDDLANSVQQTTDGGFIVAGYSTSNDGDVSGNHGWGDCWIVKLDTSGNIEWKKCLGGSDDDGAYSIEQTTDGGFIVAGYTASNDGDVSGNHGSSDYWIVKLDSSGSIEWKKCLGGSSDDLANSIQQTTDGGFVVAGYSASEDGDVSGNHGSYDYWMVKLDTSGNIEWQKCFGGSSEEQAYSIRQTTDGGFVVAGYSWSNDGDVSGKHGDTDYWIVKLYSCDQLITFYADNDDDGYGDAGVSIIAPACSPSAGYVLDSTDCDDSNPEVNPGALEISGNGIDDDCDGDIDEIEEGIANSTILQSFSVYPNPASENVFVNYTLSSPAVVKIELFDMLGNKLQELLNELDAGEHRTVIDTREFSNGVYYLKIQAGEQIVSQKIVVMK